MSADWKPVQVSIDDSSELINAINTAGSQDGIILINGINKASLINKIRKIFDKLQIPKNKEIIDNLNKAYSANLVFKDSTTLQTSNGSHDIKIDQKKSFDLSPNRISIINKSDPALLKSLGSELTSTINFFEAMQMTVAPKILEALCKASHFDSHQAKHVNFNYRIIDYQNTKNNGPRCAEHRDFGLFTLIFQDKTGGLQIQRKDNKWYDIPTDGDSVICLFGWCTQIISNNRIQATKHRVISVKKGLRRNSAVLFVAPNPDQVLVPVVKQNEIENYPNIKVCELKERMRNTWKMREGTLSQKEKVEFKHKIQSQADILNAITL